MVDTWLKWESNRHPFIIWDGFDGEQPIPVLQVHYSFGDEMCIRDRGTPVTFGQTKSNQAIGYLPDVPEFYDYMTAEEYLQLCAGLAQNQTSLPIADLLAQVGLSENKQRISTYSRGMKQRLGLAQALTHNPKILICDEPTSALDPQGRQDILSIITQLRGDVYKRQG